MFIGARRVTHMIYGILLKQLPTLEKFESCESSAKCIVNMAVENQNNLQLMPSVIQAQFSAIDSITKQTAQARTKPAKLLPWRIQFKEGGFSTQVVALAKGGATCYRCSAHIGLFGKMYLVQL
jgi:hypothetical protein